MKKNLITIIVPIYNAEKYIERCIKSIINQSYRDIEIILVDDGSKDRSAIICDEYAKKDSRIRVIHKKNEGVSKARNVGIDIAKGDYILFADSDDWLELNMCQKMIDSAIDNKSDIVVCEYNNYYENNKRTEKLILDDFNNRAFSSIITDDKKKYGGFPWNKLIKKEIIIKKFNENIHYYENLLFFLENSQFDLKYSVVHEPLYNYCINDNSAVHSKKYSTKKLSALKALEIIIPLVPNENRDYHKFVFIMLYYNNLFYIKKEKLDINIEVEYYNIIKRYYKEIKKSNRLTAKNKIKLFILYRFKKIYFYVKAVKK